MVGDILRGLENIDKFIFDADNDLGIPSIDAITEFNALNFERINMWNKVKNKCDTCLYTFVDDYRFNSVWTNPSKWLGVLHAFNSVIAPDFSLYTDMPIALQIYNHYRKMWVARLWQENGIKVIPNICWSTKESYDFCFLGQPKNSIVAISSIGAIKSVESRKYFIDGYYKMKEVLEPTKIICYGSLPKELFNEEVLRIPHFFNRSF